MVGRDEIFGQSFGVRKNFLTELYVMALGTYDFTLKLCLWWQKNHRRGLVQNDQKTDEKETHHFRCSLNAWLALRTPFYIRRDSGIQHAE